MVHIQEQLPCLATCSSRQDLDYRIQHCGTKNSVTVQVLNFLLSDSECTQSHWRTYWERKPTQIQFDSSDTASDSYCITGNTGKYYGGF